MGFSSLQECDRARALVSADLDGEITEVESLFLRAHTRWCASCSDFQAEAAAWTEALRAAPLEQRERPVAIPVRRRRGQPLRMAAAAAAVVVVATGSLLASVESHFWVPGSSGAAQIQGEDQNLARMLARYKQAGAAYAYQSRVQPIRAEHQPAVP